MRRWRRRRGRKHSRNEEEEEEEKGKTIEMSRRRSRGRRGRRGRRKENNRNVMVVVVVVLGEENNTILWPENLYKCATFYLFLSLHFAPEELTRVGSVLSAKSPLVEKIICKGT